MFSKSVKSPQPLGARVFDHPQDMDGHMHFYQRVVAPFVARYDVSQQAAATNGMQMSSLWQPRADAEKTALSATQLQAHIDREIAKRRALIVQTEAPGADRPIPANRCRNPFTSGAGLCDEGGPDATASSLATSASVANRRANREEEARKAGRTSIDLTQCAPPGFSPTNQIPVKVGVGRRSPVSSPSKSPLANRSARVESPSPSPRARLSQRLQPAAKDNPILERFLAKNAPKSTVTAKPKSKMMAWGSVQSGPRDASSGRPLLARIGTSPIVMSHRFRLVQASFLLAQPKIRSPNSDISHLARPH